MHRAYEQLHKCTEELNAAMSFPMFLTLFTSGLVTTLYLKLIFQAGQSVNFHTIAQVMIIYAAVRCCKYTILVVTPCYYSSITAKQISIIRTTLHNAINTSKMDKIERRKIKAFFLLAQDNDFSYALWGVIRFNMALPLSYTSLCTTYLVIIIQFSKFID
ncbi:uncharacterized protein LOC113237739 [Hyposmocoma kahamanoa]|uniref:uncharacterized protein LOC113237739 n=1 Tax=Hyposmocoma kahamanoa TaxID=1477025 RepID=UPI000E6D987B|nr:uncharacterized protein LOC113237739 [Hyposmocoma kahamanoa]